MLPSPPPASSLPDRCQLVPASFPLLDSSSFCSPPALAHPCNGYVLSKYELYGIASATVVLCSGLSLLPMTTHAFLFLFSGIFQLLGAVVLIILLPLLAPEHQPASFVFGSYWGNDLTNTPSAAYSFLLALQVVQFSLYGYDGVCHLAEETKRSDRTAPKAIMVSITSMSIVGWLLIVSATFSIQSVEDIQEGSPDANGYAFLQIVWDAFYARYGSGLGAQVFTGVIYSSFFFGCLVGITAAARVCFSLARDSGFPFSSVFRQVNRSTRVPVYAVILICILGLLFLLPLLGSFSIFVSVTSAQSIAWIGAYGVPIYFRMVMNEKEFQPGPFYLADYVGIIGGKIVHGLALFYVLFSVVNFSLPYMFPVDYQTLNWAPVGLAALLIILTVWWFLDARHWFVGPRVAAHEVDTVPVPKEIQTETVHFFDDDLDAKGIL